MSISMLSHETSFKATLMSIVELVTDMSISKIDFDFIASHFCHACIAIFFSYSLSPSSSGIRL